MTVWKYLQSEPIQIYHISSGLWRSILGSLYERLGRKIIRENREFFNDIFKDLNVDTISSEFVNKGKYKAKSIKFGSYRMGSPDYVYLLHCKNKDHYEKRAIIFEIKSGTSPINKEHITFWVDLINNPEKYIKKCVEVKLFVMWITGFDFVSHNLFYTLKEVKIEDIPPPDNNDITEEIS